MSRMIKQAIVKEGTAVLAKCTKTVGKRSRKLLGKYQNVAQRSNNGKCGLDSSC
jgi:hypothetical protein